MIVKKVEPIWELSFLKAYERHISASIHFELIPLNPVAFYRHYKKLKKEHRVND